MKTVRPFVIALVSLAIITPYSAYASTDLGMYLRAAEQAANKRDLQSAERLMYKLRLKTKTADGDNARKLSDAFAILSDLFGQSGKLDDMRRCMEEAISLRARAGSDDSNFIISLKSKSAKYLLEQKRPQEAFQLLDSCLKTAKSNQLEDKPGLEPVLVQLAQYHAGRGEFAQAKNYLQRAVSICKRKPDYSHDVNLPGYLRDLSLYSYGVRDPKSAERFAKESVDLSDKLFEKTDERRAANIANLAIIYKDQDRKPEADKLLSVLQSQLSGDDAKTLTASYTAGSRLIADRYYAASEPFIAKARSGYLKAEGKDGQHYIMASCNLAQTRAAKQDYAFSEKILAELKFDDTGAHRLSGTPLFQCNHEFERAWEYAYSKRQFPLALKIGQKQLEFLSSPLACPSCAHLCLEDCYKELAQTAVKMKDQKAYSKYSNAIAAFRGPAPEMK